MPLISIIIPIYNVEAYIAKCLDSVLEQSSDDIEIICVNDASPDNSRSIVVEYQKDHANLKLIDRENGGLSAARNTGIKHATGKYLLFLDSDDYLSKNVTGQMFNQMEDENLDVLLGNILWVYENGQIAKEKLITKVINGVKTGEEYFNTLIENDYYVPMAYNALCRRDFILENSLFFKEGYVYEDEMWTPEVLLKAEKVNGCALYHYNYNQRANTIINSNLSDYKLECLFEASNHILDISKKYNYTFQNTKANLLVRAFTIFGLLKKDYKNKIDSKAVSNYSIINLIKEKLPKKQFEICLQNSEESKFLRRIYRIVYKFKFIY